MIDQNSATGELKIGSVVRLKKSRSDKDDNPTLVVRSMAKVDGGLDVECNYWWHGDLKTVKLRAEQLTLVPS